MVPSANPLLEAAEEVCARIPVDHIGKRTQSFVHLTLCSVLFSLFSFIIMSKSF